MTARPEVDRRTALSTRLQGCLIQLKATSSVTHLGLDEALAVAALGSALVSLVEDLSLPLYHGPTLGAVGWSFWLLRLEFDDELRDA